MSNPITVTLTFANAAELVAYFQGTSLVPVTKTEVKPEAAKAEPAKKSKADATASAPASQQAEQPVAETPATTPETGGEQGNAAAEPSEPEVPAASTSSSPKPVDYATLQKAVFTLAGKDKASAMAVAASFKVKTFKELPEDKWAEALAAVNAKIAEQGA